MRIVRKRTELRRLMGKARQSGRTVGFVPTMGALHEGHLSLIRRARSENDCVVVSIFVNPLQFDRREDLRSYPRPLSRDIRLASEAGVDLLFLPSAQEMVPPRFQTTVEVEQLSRPWEGRFRPGHFRGVATVVAKLFHLVEPHVAYFGQKDAQQARLIRQMIRDLDFPVRLRVMPVVREPGGLAMSSRNRRLTPDGRSAAAGLFHALQEARRLIELGCRREGAIVRRMKGVLRRIRGARMDYVAVVDPDTLERVPVVRKEALAILAVWIGKVRLIDCGWLRPKRRV